MSKHSFLNATELEQILYQLEKKKEVLEIDIAILEIAISPPEREKAGSEDGSVYQEAIYQVEIHKSLLQRERQKLEICYEAIELIKKDPRCFGFHPKTGKPLPLIYLEKLLFLKTQPAFLPKKPKN